MRVKYERNLRRGGQGGCSGGRSRGNASTTGSAAGSARAGGVELHSAASQRGVRAGASRNPSYTLPAVPGTPPPVQLALSGKQVLAEAGSVCWAPALLGHTPPLILALRGLLPPHTSSTPLTHLTHSHSHSHRWRSCWPSTPPTTSSRR